MVKSESEQWDELLAGDWGRIITKARVDRYKQYLEEKEFLKDSIGIDLKKSQGGILRKHDIVSLSNSKLRKLPLIDPLDPEDPDELLKPASYLLRLGSHYRVDDEEGFLEPDSPTLVIPRHGIAIVTTYEWLNIPTFLIARWNLRVHRVYDGLVWVGGPQVDPGYQGFLFCPLYNLSNKDQELTYGRGTFTIDFELVTTFEEKSNEKLSWKPREPRDTFTFLGLDKQKIKSAPKEQFKDIENKMTAVENKTETDIDKLESKIERFQDNILVIIGVIIAALAIIAGFGIAKTTWVSDGILYVATGVAVAMSIIAIIIAKRKKNK